MELCVAVICGRLPCKGPVSVTRPPTPLLPSWWWHWKAQFEICHNLLTAPRKLSPILGLKWLGCNQMQIMCNTLGVYHMQYVVCHAVWRGSSAVKLDRIELAFILGLLHLLKPLPMKEGRKWEYLEKAHSNRLQKMPHTRAQTFKPQLRAEPVL